MIELFPPAGAESESVWLLKRGTSHIAARWSKERWFLYSSPVSCSPRDVALAGYHLTDPHGTAAAAQELRRWQSEGPGRITTLMRSGELFITTLSELNSERREMAMHPTSELATVLDAVAAWEAQNG